MLVVVVYEPDVESAAHATHHRFTSRLKIDKLLESALQQIDFATSLSEHVSIVSTMFVLIVSCAFNLTALLTATDECHW